MSDPPPEAYGRVTNPERYRVVHDAARQLIEHLCRSFAVAEDRRLDADPALSRPGVVVEEMVRLVPLAADAAPVTLALTTFPGVLTHVGRWITRSYPFCGCDACDEDPNETIDELRRDVEALIAGRVSEEWDGKYQHCTTVYADGAYSRGSTLVERDRSSYGKPRRYEWRPWPKPARQ